MKNTFALALALGLTSGLAPLTSFAAGLEQRGQPETAPVALPTYGVDVPIRSALKTVIPAGWQLFVHQSAKLPTSVSWTLGEVWPTVLGSIAETSNLAVLVDWEKHTVLIRTEAVAALEQETRSEIYLAATTPLPTFGATSTPAELDAVTAPATPLPVFVEVASPPEPIESMVNVEPAPLAPLEQLVSVNEPEVEKQVHPVVTAALEWAARMNPQTTPALLDAPGLTPASNMAAKNLDAPPPGKVEPEKDVTPANNVESDKPDSAALASLKRKTELQAALHLAQVETAQLQAAKHIAQEDAARQIALRKQAEVYAAEQRQVTGSPNPYNDVMPGMPVSMQINGLPVGNSGKTSAPVTSTLAPAPAVALVARPVAMDTPMTVKVSVVAVPAPVLAATTYPVQMKSTDKFNYVQAIALNKAPARKVAQAIAQKYGMRLVWAAPEVNLRGPVTLLAQSAEEDVFLLKKALGTSAGLSFDLQPGGKQLTVNSTDTGYFHIADAVAPVSATLPGAAPALVTPADMPMDAPAPVHALAPLEAPFAVSDLPAFSAPVISEPIAPLVSRVKPAFVLTLAANEPLENALVRMFKAHGYTYEWKVSGGFEAARQLVFEGESLAKVLSQVLPSLGVSADVYTSDKHVVVRPGEARDK
jgi:hypothetical protein